MHFLLNHKNTNISQNCNYSSFQGNEILPNSYRKTDSQTIVKTNKQTKNKYRSTEEQFQTF